MQKELLTKKDVATIGEEISHEMAADFVGAYHQANPNDTTGYTIGRNIIDQILAQPGCVGMRLYNALNEAGQKTLVYVAVDASGKDITKKVVVEENGSLVTVPAIVADRVYPGVGDLLTGIIGR
ncbi:MAG TPA: hypothetical protein VNS58_31775 [Puia sp.]|nr:hypothetical protein [Puia sp.]